MNIKPDETKQGEGLNLTLAYDNNVRILNPEPTLGIIFENEDILKEWIISVSLSCPYLISSRPMAARNVKPGFFENLDKTNIEVNPVLEEELFLHTDFFIWIRSGEYFNIVKNSCELILTFDFSINLISWLEKLYSTYPELLQACTLRITNVKPDFFQDFEKVFPRMD